MNTLDILKQDLMTHEGRLIELRDDNFGKKRCRKGGLTIESNLNPECLVPSYVKIIKSIKEEIVEIESKQIKK